MAVKFLKILSRDILFLLLVATLILPLNGLAHADTVIDGWLSAGNPELKSTALAPDYTPPYSYNYNTDCHRTDFNVITREAKLIPVPPFIQTELRHQSACAVSTPWGMSDGVYVNSSLPAAKFVGMSGGLAMIPNSKALMSLQTVINGVSLEPTFWNGFTPQVNPTTGEVQLVLRGSHFLTDQNGTKIYLRPGAMAYSSDGRWMVADSTAGFIRVNLEDTSVLPFAPGLNYESGFNPNPKVAISPDGRYAAISYGINTFKIYDLSTCSGPLNCQFKDIQPFLNSKLGSPLSSYYIRFASPDFLTFVVDYRDQSGTFKKASIRMVPHGKVIEDISYLALGDSFSSGEGEMDDNYYENGTDEPENKCHLSKRSYPYLVASTLGLSDFHSIACSGASFHPNYGGFPQYNAAPSNNSLGDWLPGMRTQQEFIRFANASTVTVSMIGNDIGFSGKMIRCLAPDSCFHFKEDRQSIVNEINDKFETLVNLYQDIRQKSNNANIYVLGYPQLFSTIGDCPFSTSLDAEERETAKGLVGYLNAVIKAATERAGVQYIDVENAFHGHLLCGDGRSAVNGLTSGDDKGLFGVNVVGNESFHPNGLGHQLLAEQLMIQSQNFAKPMPAPGFSVGVPGISSQAYVDFMRHAPSGGRLIRVVYTGGDVIKGVIKNNPMPVDITNLTNKPNSIFEAWFNSDPTFAGTLTTDENGALHGNITIPDSLDPGFHTLHLYGKDLADKDIDLYQTVYVAESVDDFDGDGILNQNEQCLVTEPINIDKDRDGIDDACDPEIGEVPLDTIAPTVTGTADRSPNTDGWYNSDVMINWVATDPEPSSGAPTQPIPSLASQEGVHLYTSDQSCDPLNNCATGSLELKIDKTNPLVTQFVAPAANANNWYHTDVTITSSCDDSLSGILNCSLPVTLSTEGSNQIVKSTATDRAGNIAEASTRVNIDKTPPILATPLWANNPKSVLGTATITLPAADNLSGITEAEYYLGDIDPGEGNGATMQVSGGAISVGFNTDFPTGVYKITMRAKDAADNWSAPVTDYLVVYNPFGTRITGKRTILPSLASGDILPGLIAANQDDNAKFGFNVRYDTAGQIDKHSDFQFTYKTGTKCNKPAQAINCHSLELNATSIAWLTTQGQNDSTGIFQGAAKLEVDGTVSNVIFRLTGLDGERLNESSEDQLSLLVYPADTNPNTADPIYRAEANLQRGNIKIRRW